MKAIFINAVKREISEIEIEKGLKPLYDLIGCDLVTVVNIDPENDLYLDDEGLLKLNHESAFFKFGNFDQYFAGNGIVLGYDDETGDSKSTTVTLEKVKRMVEFKGIVEMV